MAGKKNAIPENPHIVEDFYIGNVHIQIADDMCVSKEEAEKIMERISIRAKNALTEQYRRKGIIF